MVGSETELREHVLKSNRRAVILGATGSVGSRLLAKLLASSEWSKVTSIGRRPLSSNQLGGEGKEDGGVGGKVQVVGKLIHHTINMDRLRESQELMKDHDVLFCCLGTTRNQV